MTPPVYASGRVLAPVGTVVRIDDQGRCGVVTDDGRVLVYGTVGTQFANYPYRLGAGAKTYGLHTHPPA